MGGRPGSQTESLAEAQGGRNPAVGSEARWEAGVSHTLQGPGVGWGEVARQDPNSGADPSPLEEASMLRGSPSSPRLESASTHPDKVVSSRPGKAVSSRPGEVASSWEVVASREVAASRPGTASPVAEVPSDPSPAVEALWVPIHRVEGVPSREAA